MCKFSLHDIFAKIYAKKKHRAFATTTFMNCKMIAIQKKRYNKQ